MAKLLLLVHGMGVHGTTWSDDIVADLNTAATSFGLGGRFSTALGADVVTVKPIRYDDRFRAEVGKWGNDARTFASFIKTNGIKVPANITAWLENADATENNFLWSHVVDVILYRYFNEVATDVRVHVAQTVVSEWQKALDADPHAEVSVLAHSLGTSVTHDTLALLATEPPAGATGFLAGDRQLKSIFMLANVSQVLQTSPRVTESVICPPSVRAKAYCATMFNARHALDPFPAVRAFTPGWLGKDFLQIDTTAVRAFNVHDFQHYLRDPRVHVPLLRSLFGFSSIGKTDAADAIAEYEADRPSTCPALLAGFVQDWRQRVQTIKSADIRTLIASGVEFLDDVKTLRTACAGGP